MKARQNRSARGEYPHLIPSDVISAGELMLFRNPKGRKFGERDAWCLSEPWDTLDDIRPAYAKLSEKESELGAKNQFAWNSEFGYLSPFPEHCGTGLLIRADFHLEALHLIGDLPAVLNGLEAVRFEARGINLDGFKNAAHFFDVFTNASLGVTEEDLIVHAERVFSALIEQENNARLRLVQELPRVLEDSLTRALAVLKACRLLSPWEYLDILSPIRLAAILGFLDGMTLTEANDLLYKQLAARDDIPPDSPDGVRLRDERDAAIADEANSIFSRVKLNKRAKELFS